MDHYVLLSWRKHASQPERISNSIWFGRIDTCLVGAKLDGRLGHDLDNIKTIA
jgi:hypothetical protein